MRASFWATRDISGFEVAPNKLVGRIAVLGAAGEAKDEQKIWNQHPEGSERTASRKGRGVAASAFFLPYVAVRVHGEVFIEKRPRPIRSVRGDSMHVRVDL